TPCVLYGGDRKRSAAAGGNAHYHIIPSRFLSCHLFAAKDAGVLAGFGGGSEGFFASCNDELDRPRVSVKGRRTLGSIQGGNASAGASAHVNEASPPGEGRGDQVDCARDLRENTLDSRRDLGILGVDDLDDFQRRFAVEIGGRRVGFLGCESPEVSRFAFH